MFIRPSYPLAVGGTFFCDLPRRGELGQREHHDVLQLQGHELLAPGVVPGNPGYHEPLQSTAELQAPNAAVESLPAHEPDADNPRLFAKLR